MNYAAVERDGWVGAWFDSTLWRAAAGLPVLHVSVAELARDLTPDHFAQYSEGEEGERTARVALTYPIILGPNGGILDGWHRLARAIQLGVTHLPTVTLPAYPDSDPDALAAWAEESAAAQ